MIVPMKKVTLLSLAAHRDETLESLRALGAVHIAPLQLPQSGDLEAARRTLEESRAALTVLDKLARENPPAGNTPAQPESSPDQLLRKAIAVIERLRERRDAIQRLDEQLLQVAALGDFDPAQWRDLLNRGISLRVFRSEPKAALALPDDAVRVELKRDKATVHFALLNAPAWSHPAAIELPVPERAPADLRHDRALAASGLAEDESELIGLTPHKPAMAKAVEEQESRVHWLETRDGMAAEGPLLLLQGYLPARELPGLEALGKKRGWGWLAVDPADTDPVPTLIEGPRWIRPIHLLFDMLGILPGYREVDVSPIFLAFFSFFFAMLVGDAVYGLLFLGLTVLIHKKWKAAPRNLVPLLGILSVATIIWGILTGSYLGIEALPGPLRALKLKWLADPDNVHLQQLCFFVGALHMSLAHAWNVWRLRRHVTGLSHVGWIGLCWAMYSLVNNLVLDQPLLPGTLPLAFASMALILLFTVAPADIKKEYTALLTLPFGIIGNFGDVISYLRLYLVGYASVVLVKAFNEMLFPGGPLHVVQGLVGVLVLFLVHILNIMLSSLAVLVHGFRLNALEFSMHMGIQWLGFKYNPFRKRSVP